MLTKIKDIAKTIIFTLGIWIMTAQMAFATGEGGGDAGGAGGAGGGSGGIGGGVTTKTAGDVSTAIVNTFKDVLLPIGGAIIFITVAVCAFQLIMTANNPEGRAKALGSMPYIIGGGVLLGGALLIAGFILGLGEQMQ